LSSNGIDNRRSTLNLFSCLGGHHQTCAPTVRSLLQQFGQQSSIIIDTLQLLLFRSVDHILLWICQMSLISDFTHGILLLTTNCQMIVADADFIKQSGSE
jgi:hypothetical protein